MKKIIFSLFTLFLIFIFCCKGNENKKELKKSPNANADFETLSSDSVFADSIFRIINSFPVSFVKGKTGEYKDMNLVSIKYPIENMSIFGEGFVGKYEATLYQKNEKTNSFVIFRLQNTTRGGFEENILRFSYNHIEKSIIINDNYYYNDDFSQKKQLVKVEDLNTNKRHLLYLINKFK